MNPNWFDKFEEYLNEEMSREDKSLFEALLAEDEEMSQAFQVYRTIETEMRNHEKYSVHESALKQSLQGLNERYFSAQLQQTAKIVPLYPRNLYTIFAAIAASIIIIVVAYITLVLPSRNTQHLADNYFKTHLQELSQTMDASSDSLQLGIAAYNNQEYNKALHYFQMVYRHHPENLDAKRNIGLVYLATKEYDKALQQFDELAEFKNVRSNPGLFLKALTLMQRDQEGDKEKAKQLLQQVMNEKAEGSKEAKIWLEKF